MLIANDRQRRAASFVLDALHGRESGFTNTADMRAQLGATAAFEARRIAQRWGDCRPAIGWGSRVTESALSK